MRIISHSAVAMCIAAISTGHLCAQTVDVGGIPRPVDTSSASTDDENEIVVVATRLRGDVVGNIAPQVSFSAGEVRSLGVSNVTELLSELAPQISTGSGSGTPVILVNGLRTTGFTEVRDLPTEAIERVDIFPEELALRYGYRADQRVVNIVLRGKFSATVVQASGNGPSAGGRATEKVEATKLKIDKNHRVSINGQYQHDSALLESERSLVNNAPLGTVDQRPWRTLLAAGDTASLNGSFVTTLGDTLSATLNARGEASDTRSGIGALSSGGLGGALLPLTRQVNQRTGHVGTMLTGAVTGWQWSLTGNYDITGIHSTTDRSARVQDDARSTAQTGVVELVTSGPIVQLPAGAVTLTAQTSGKAEGYSSVSRRQSGMVSSDLSRRTGSAQASIDLPIASARRDVLQPLGTLSANFNMAIDSLSDFGSLKRWGYGASWTPVDAVNFIVSATNEDTAPSMQQLGGALITTPNARIFDYGRQETVDVTRTDGGNPLLLASRAHIFRLGATVRPLGDKGPTLSANYSNTRTSNAIAAFPVATPEVETAFPGRFVRDSSGRLVSIDARPTNFAQSRQQQLRWGINYSARLGAAPIGREGSMDGRSRDGAQENIPPIPGAFGGRGFGGGGRAARVQFSLYHTWQFRNDILIQNGGPVLDLLNGSAVGNGGGVPRHLIEIQSGLTKNGLGIRLSGKWQSATDVRSVTNPARDLRFSALATVGVRVFAQFGPQRELIKRHPWLRGLRISLGVENIMDAHQYVRDGTGLVPINYQPDYLDPLGRTVRLSIRKVFF